MNLREPLTSENFMITYHPALECILKKLDFISLLNFTRAVFTFDELLREIDLRYETKEAERWLTTRINNSDDWIQSKVKVEMTEFNKTELKRIILTDIRCQKRFKGIICMKMCLKSPRKTTEENCDLTSVQFHSRPHILFRRWEHSDIIDEILNEIEYKMNLLIIGWGFEVVRIFQLILSYQM